MLKLSDTYIFNAPSDQIWPMIFNPQSLLNAIPGCEQLDQISPKEYRSTIKFNVGPIQGSYQVDIRILEMNPPQYCRMQGEVSGLNGNITGDADFKLDSEGQRTRLTYQGNAIISGALGKLNSRFVEGIATSLIKQGLDKLHMQIYKNGSIQSD